MRDSIKISLIALLMCVLVRGFDVSYVIAGLQAVPAVWDTSTFEGNPGWDFAQEIEGLRKPTNQFLKKEETEDEDE